MVLAKLFHPLHVWRPNSRCRWSWDARPGSSERARCRLQQISNLPNPTTCSKPNSLLLLQNRLTRDEGSGQIRIFGDRKPGGTKTKPACIKVRAGSPVPRKRLGRNFSNSASGGRLSRATVWSRKGWERSKIGFCIPAFVETRLPAPKLRTPKHCKSKTKSSIPRIPKGNPHEASGRPASPKHSVSGIRLDTLGSASAGMKLHEQRGRKIQHAR